MAFDFPQSKSRMFRVQFSGGSQEEALERCCNCVQTLAQYVTVQAPDSMVQQLQQSPGPLGAGESQGKDPLQQGVSAAVWLHKKPDDVMHGGDPGERSGPQATHSHLEHRSGWSSMPS